MGLPVVVTSAGGMPDAVTDGREGIVVSPGATDELAVALTTLVRDPHLRTQMGAAAAERGRMLSIDGALRRLEDIYDAVATPRTTGGGRLNVAKM